MKQLSVVLAILISLVGLVGFQSPKTSKDLDKAELKMIAGLAASTQKTRAAYFKSPKDAKAKQSFISAAFKEAEAVLVSPAIIPKDKYPRSLRLYREIVRVDPRHKKSLERISLIEGIYKSMGRPIPK